jgi:hypothetical protein
VVYLEEAPKEAGIHLRFVLAKHRTQILPALKLLHIKSDGNAAQ